MLLSLWCVPKIDEISSRQTCNINETAFADAVFPTMFHLELDPCPSDLDYTTFYEIKYGELSVVSTRPY